MPPPQVAPLSFVFIAYVVVSLISLGRVNVPMFTALRRLTILFVMVEEYFLLRISPSARVVATVAVMFIGAAIAAWKDLTYDPVSYAYLFLTNLFTSLYTVYINKVKEDTGLNIFAMMYYNNVTTMPALLVRSGSGGRAYSRRPARGSPSHSSTHFRRRAPHPTPVPRAAPRVVHGRPPRVADIHALPLLHL